MLGDREDVLVAAAAEIHDDDLVLAHGRGELDHLGERMRRLQRRHDPLVPVQSWKASSASSSVAGT